MNDEGRIDRAIDIAANAEIDHPAIGDAGAQREDRRRVHVARHRALFHRRRRRGRGARRRRNRRTDARHLVGKKCKAGIH